MKRSAENLIDSDAKNVLVTFQSPKSVMAEAFRVLRTNLGFAGVERPFSTVLISSALAEEGKSTVVSNLAMVTAQAGYKVMLVDCDLRRPKLHKIFQIPNNAGFTDCILNNVDPDQVAYTLTLPNIKVLTSGAKPPNPAEIINSERTRKLWQQLKLKYDFVFVDSPPIMVVADANILAAQLDASVLVIRSGSTRSEAVLKAQERLVNANSRILGVVLNRVKSGKRDPYSYSY